jgi:hypothetical protein
MGGKSQQRKRGTWKTKKRGIRVTENQMRMRNKGAIKTMEHEICMAHQQHKFNRQFPQQVKKGNIRGRN